ncbi:MAG: hypothetical protein HWE33_17245 [Rhodobacteraceae bacterium]|nr:hypothetical protein [Paracoccaceae bacterium]
MAKDRYYSNPTQIYWVCKNLIAGRTLTHKTEIREVNGWRLAAVIHKLKEDFHWPIRDQYRGKDNIKHYWLAPGTDPRFLSYPVSAVRLKDELEGGEA